MLYMLALYKSIRHWLSFLTLPQPGHIPPAHGLACLAHFSSCGKIRLPTGTLVLFSAQVGDATLCRNSRYFLGKSDHGVRACFTSRFEPSREQYGAEDCQVDMRLNRLLRRREVLHFGTSWDREPQRRNSIRSLNLPLSLEKQIYVRNQVELACINAWS